MGVLFLYWKPHLAILQLGNPDVLSQSLGCGHYSEELHFGLSHFRLSPLTETTWLVFNKEKWAWPEEAKSHTGKALLDHGRAPLATCVKKCYSSFLGRSWRTWRALIRAGESTMLFVLGRVDLLDGVTTALEDASSISWLLGFWVLGFWMLGFWVRVHAPHLLWWWTGCPCCFFPLGNESFHLCQRAKTHTHIFEIILYHFGWQLG